MVFLDMPSGLRRGELAGLKWEDFDFKNLHVSVTPSLVDQHIGPVKTEGIDCCQILAAVRDPADKFLVLIDRNRRVH